MNTTFPEVLAGTTTSTASPFVINGTLPYAANPNTYLTGIFRGDYFIRYLDNVTVGFESGYGSYNAATDTLTVLKVYMSSNGDGVACSTFTSAAKHIGFTVAGNELGGIAQLFIDKPPHLDILIVSSAQSVNGNAGFYVDQGAAPADNPNNLDYTTTGIDGQVGLAWRLVNTSVDDALCIADFLAVNNNNLVGLCRGEGASKRGSITKRVADKLQKFTGRRVRTIHDWRNGTAINAANGWGYVVTGSKTTANAAEHLKIIVGEAIAAIIADDPTQAGITPDLFIFAQGQTDVSSGTSSSAYATYAHDFFCAIRDPLRWGWASKYMPIFIPDFSEEFKRGNSRIFWSGHRAAKELHGDTVTLVSLDQTFTFDGTHQVGETQDITGDKMIQAMVSTTKDTSTQGVFAVRKVITPYGGLWQYKGVADTLPPAGMYYRNVAGTHIKIHKTSVFADTDPLGGFGTLRKGESFRLGVTAAATNTRAYVVTGLVTRSSDVWTIPCTETVSGTPPAVDAYSTLGGLYLFSTPESLVAATDLPVAFGTLTETLTPNTVNTIWRNRTAYIDGDGILRRSTSISEVIQRMSASGVATHELYSSPSFGTGGFYLVDILIVGRVGTTVAQTYVGKTTNPALLYSSNGTAISNLNTIAITDVYNPDAIATPTLFMNTASGNFHVRWAGKASRDFEFTTTIKYTDLLAT